MLKIFCLVTLVLSLVLGFGVMLRPLRQFSIEPEQVPKLIGYTFPITLTMVIPIAALLSATLNYGRLAHFNEINACRTSGISLRTLIYPAAAFALLGGILTLVLSFHVVPSFMKKFEQTVTADAESIIFRNIQKRGDLGKMFPDIRIYADHAIPEEHRLTGVVVMRLDRQKIDWVVTAEQVVFEFQTEPNPRQILMHLYQATLIKDHSSVHIPQDTFSMTPPSLWRDNIKFKNLSELRQIEQDKTAFEPINALLNEFRRQYLWERFFFLCDQQARREGRAIDLYAGSEPIRILAERCLLQIPSQKAAQREAVRNRTAQLVGLDGGPIEVIAPYGVGPPQERRYYQAQRASLSNNPFFPNAPPMLILEQVEWGYGGRNERVSLVRHEINEVAFFRSVEEECRSLTLDEVRRGEPLERLETPSPYLQDKRLELDKGCQKLATEIRLEKHSRLAFGAGCAALVILGTVLGMVFRSGHLLTAFGVSFIPAALCLITIFTGKHIAEKSPDAPAMGMAFLWSGILAVALVNIFIYRALSKR